MNKNILLDEILARQLNNLPENYKISYKDFLRILKYIKSSLLCEDFCCIWTGNVTQNDDGQNEYISFVFRKDKISLQRLLYINFIGPLQDNEDIKYKCKNKGRCCNINHLIKMTKEEKDKKVEEKIQKEKEELKRSFTIEFD